MLKRRLFKLFDKALTEIPRFVRFWCCSASVSSCIEIGSVHCCALLVFLVKN